MSSVKFSIIIPVYNGEKFVADAIESVLRQDYDNWQLILVNDGSSDLTGKICSDYANKDFRIIYIEQENQGLSGARNSGYFKADGDYILFCDADDYYTDNALSVLAESIRNTQNPDMLAFGFLVGNGKWPVIVSEYPMDKKLDKNYISKNVIPEQLNLHPKNDNKYIATFVCCKAYRHSFLKANNIVHSQQYKKWEDKLFILTALDAAESLVFLNNAIYYYRLVNSDHLAEKYFLDTMLYVVSQFRDYQQLFKGKYNLYTDYSKRYYFDVISKLIIEALEIDSSDAMPTICKVLDSPEMKNWTSGIIAKTKSEKLIQASILNSDYSNIQALYQKYGVELSKIQKAKERKQHSLIRRGYQRLKALFSK